MKRLIGCHPLMSCYIAGRILRHPEGRMQTGMDNTMWFRNIHFYKFEEPFRLTSEQLHQALDGRRARACGQMELVSEGWDQPLGRAGKMLVHETDRNMMICMRREEKILPSSLVREQLDEHVFKVEQSAGRPVGRKERSDLKEHVLQQLMPRALARSSHTFACILPAEGWLVVNAASSAKSEAVVELLRKSLGVLPVALPATEQSPESAMTHWLLNDHALPEGFAIEDECELHAGSGAGGVIRCRNLDVSSSEIRAHVSAGRSVKKLAMNWRDSLSFILHEDLSIRRLRFDEAIVGEAGELAEDEVTRFDADFAIMAAQLRSFIPELLAALGTKA